MKCQNCGKNEVNFHYSSSVNGAVTEAHLCSDCAEKSGYDLSGMFDTGSLFSSIFPRSMRRMFMPMPIFGFGIAPIYAELPQAGAQETECACGGACEAPVQENPTTEVDSEMQRRREINAIREQMCLAAEKEDFERAAQLRDQVRQMEAE